MDEHNGVDKDEQREDDAPEYFCVRELHDSGCNSTIVAVTPGKKS
jgi:hypothetical protein